MDERLNLLAASANATTYDLTATKDYVDGAPHIKLASLRSLYWDLLVQVYDYAVKHTDCPHVLDLGAGEGEAALSFLELGARVTAVDISMSQIDALGKKCEQFADRLELRCEKVQGVLADRGCKYDVVVTNSFLHHVPDYLGMIKGVVGLLSPHGQLFTFQDPLRHDSVSAFTRAFTDVAYLSWRLFKGDFWGGLGRRLRRWRGAYLADSVYDNTDYHILRNGVDQEALKHLLERAGLKCRVVRYCSTQSRIFQRFGNILGVENTFALIAQRSVQE